MDLRPVPKLLPPGALAAACALFIASAAHADDAVTLSAAYRGDFWGNVDGGIKTGHRYFDDLLLRATVDTEQAFGWHGGMFNIIGLHNNGADFTGQFVGASQVISNTETYSAFRLYEIWYDQHFLEDRFSLRVGLYDLNSEFDANETGSLFVNSSHGIGTDFSQSGQAGPSIFPVTSLAARLEWHVAPDVTVRAAILDGVPGDPAHPKRAVAIKLGHGDGALVVGEVDAIVLETSLAVGAWGYTASFDDLNAVDPVTGSPLKRGDNRGAYVKAERRVFSVSEEEGLNVFARFGVAESNINMFSSYLGAGAVYDNIAPDTAVGFAVASAKVGKPYRQAQAALGLPSEKRETIFEATMATHPTSWFGIQPSVQYVINPSAAPGVRNALVLGLRFEIFGATSF